MYHIHILCRSSPTVICHGLPHVFLSCSSAWSVTLLTGLPKNMSSVACAAKFRYPDLGSGGESHGVSDAGLLCS